MGGSATAKGQTYFAGYALQRLLFQCLDPTMKKGEKTNPQSDSSRNRDERAPEPPEVPKVPPAPRRPHGRARAERAARGRRRAGRGGGRGARTGLSDNDRGFMINSGRFKYLLSQGFRGGEPSASRSHSRHGRTSGPARPLAPRRAMQVATVEPGSRRGRSQEGAGPGQQKIESKPRLCRPEPRGTAPDAEPRRARLPPPRAQSAHRCSGRGQP